MDRAYGSPWRDLPEAFEERNSVFRRFSRWSVKGVWWRIFEAMSDNPHFEYLIVDSTIVWAHQHAAGAKKGGSEKSSARPLAPTSRHVRINICSTRISSLAPSRGLLPAACCFSKLKQFRRVATASKRPPKITVPSLLLQPPSYGAGKCPRGLGTCGAIILVAGDDSRYTNANSGSDT